ncbi:thioredoxin domain-containing protein [Sphingobacterium sp. HJSM2_6]|uniref:thioredoxin domain-containing protein n=1 Tax=Sphingobacterium sp. HJSM2_6 TaxID=3366264 RepID=UPI003BD1F482
MVNKLAQENSPYLKQHAHNPVQWFPWGQEALAKAKEENKLIIVSIGYSACHWCHVMERESFENEAIAATMNKFFVSIKVDREERPDIDQIYMIAVQLMTNAGGWPLNCICLPDGRPIYGGTYFKPHDWQQVLLQIAQMWEDKPAVAIDYAEKLTEGIVKAEQLAIQPILDKYTLEDIQQVLQPWKNHFDPIHGGYTRAPKFPLPNNWSCLLRTAVLLKDEPLLEHVHFTLKKMATGGIYDHIGGGFSRYAVDERWHVPHFEKMLYDNAQLISLYAEAYQQDANPLYKQVVQETITWLVREMRDSNGGFYSALDADSEGVEGKFYTFSYDEFEVLGENADLARSYYHISRSGNWTEEQINIPYVNIEEENLIAESGYRTEEWQTLLQEIKSDLLAYRNQRIRPGLDHKQLISWNALLMKGLIDAYHVFDEQSYLNYAIDIANFILTAGRKNESLLHQPEDNNRMILAFLDDYSFSIDAFISLYEATFDEQWLYMAKDWADQAIENCYDHEKNCFYYTQAKAELLIARKSEVMDNVIPSSSSSMVRQLHKLGLFFDHETYTLIAEKTFANVFPYLKSYGSAYSNWTNHLLDLYVGIYEIAISGTDSISWKKELQQHYIPNKILMGGTKSTLPLLEHKASLESKSYLCIHKTCSLPQSSIAAIVELINNKQGK